MSESWVINASPIIFLGKLGLIERVPAMCSRLVIPVPVAAEVNQRGAADRGAEWLQRDGQSFIQNAVAEPDSVKGTGIGAGERAVLSWALKHAGFISVLDDLAARREAQRLHLPVLGTVGVLLRLKASGQIALLKPYLLNLRQIGGHVGEPLFQEALRRAGEKA